MKERNLQLDYLKVIMSIFVIGIHSSIFTNQTINELFRNGISRIAVPTFLIINGYYLINTISSKEKSKALFIRLIKLYLVWWIIYLPFKYNDFDYYNIINGYMHLWYLSHLALAILLFYYLKKFIPERLMFIIAISLYILGCSLQAYRSLGFTFPIGALAKDSTVRNFIFFSFPMVYIGYSMHNLKIWKTLSRYKLLIILTGFILLLCETYFFHISNHYSDQDLYLGCLLISPFLFIYFKDKPKVKVEDDFYSKLYIAIYLTHYMAIMLVNSVFQNVENFTMKFILILFFTLLISAGIININRRINIFL